MEALSLENKVEADNFLNTILVKNTAQFEEFTHIGGVTTALKASDKWYWVNSGKKVNYTMKFHPGHPDGAGWCLAVQKRGNDFYFKDIPCHSSWEIKFICQRDEL